MKLFDGNIIAILAMMVAIGHGQTEAPTETAVPTSAPVPAGCYTTLQELNFKQLNDIATGVAGHITYNLCDGRTYNIGNALDSSLANWDADMPLLVARSDTTFQCNGCILTGGYVQIQFISEIPGSFFGQANNVPVTTNNVLLKGMTCTGTAERRRFDNLELFLLSFLAPGTNITVQDLTIKDSKWFHGIFASTVDSRGPAEVTFKGLKVMNYTTMDLDPSDTSPSYVQSLLYARPPSKFIVDDAMIENVEVPYVMGGDGGSEFHDAFLKDVEAEEGIFAALNSTPAIMGVWQEDSDTPCLGVVKWLRLVAENGAVTASNTGVCVTEGVFEHTGLPSVTPAPTATPQPEGCFTSLQAMNFKQLNDIATSVQGTITYSLCDGRTYNIGNALDSSFTNWDGDMPLLAARSDSIFECNGCILTGGYLQAQVLGSIPGSFFGVPDSIPVRADNIVFRGMTFTGTAVNRAFDGAEAFLFGINAPGTNILLEDITIKDSAWSRGFFIFASVNGLGDRAEVTIKGLKVMNYEKLECLGCGDSASYVQSLIYARPPNKVRVMDAMIEDVEVPYVFAGDDKNSFVDVSLKGVVAEDGIFAALNTTPAIRDVFEEGSDTPCLGIVEIVRLQQEDGGLVGEKTGVCTTEGVFGPHVAPCENKVLQQCTCAFTRNRDRCDERDASPNWECTDVPGRGCFCKVLNTQECFQEIMARDICDTVRGDAEIVEEIEAKQAEAVENRCITPTPSPTSSTLAPTYNPGDCQSKINKRCGCVFSRRATKCAKLGQKRGVLCTFPNGGSAPCRCEPNSRPNCVGRIIRRKVCRKLTGKQKQQVRKKYDEYFQERCL